MKNLESIGVQTEPRGLDELKREFSERLDGILNKQLTVDNIGSFADDALNELLALTGDALEEYKNNPVLEGDLSLVVRAQENAVCAKLDLPNLQEVLDSIAQVKDTIDSLSTYIHRDIEKVDEVITPPDKGGSAFAPGESDESPTEKKLFPRTLTLLYLLKQDFDLDPEDLVVVEGITTEDMVRQTPYRRVEIPDLERAIYICDEESNASYVFDQEVIEAKGLSIEQIDLASKDEKKALIEKYPGLGVRVIQTKNWRANIANWLQNPLAEKEDGALNEPEKPDSEFKRERKKSLSFEDFKEEVVALYHLGYGSVSGWYQKERKKHPSWPASPEQVYKNQGWVGFPELVGKDNPKKKKWLSFEDFQEEVSGLYKPEYGNVHVWYKEELKKHPNWPTNPYDMYEGKGFVGLPELVGKENPLKREWLRFEDFKREVVDLYKMEYGDVQRWYHEERRNHANWPKAPGQVYGDKGWVDWSELVGKENPLKKERPSFELFKDEVGGLYKTEYGGVVGWYRAEQKKHPNWPSSPEKAYVGNGWADWSDLVGVENPKKIERLRFEDFKQEVGSLYRSEYGNIFQWYRKECKKHPNWPVNAPRFYKDYWKGWPQLVDKK